MFASKLLALATALFGVQNATGTPIATAMDEKNIGTLEEFEAGIVEWFWSTAEGLPISTDSNQKRQAGTYITNTHTVGDGTPHQNRKFQQVTQSTQCPGGDCTATKSESTTVGYSVNIGGQYSWISGGFSVSESKTDGESHSCSNSGHDAVCVWRNYQVTAYTVADSTCYYFNGAASMCSGDSNQRIIFSPNDCQNDSPFVCMYDGDCPALDSNYLVEDGPAGGPPC